MKTFHFHTMIAAALLGAVAFTGGVTQLAAQTVGEKASVVVSDAQEKVQDAGQAAASKFEELWQRIDEGRLKNRTPDEIVAWVIMGLVVGSIMGRTTGLRPWTSIVFGLIGALLGGIVVHVTQLNLGLGPVLIRYEDLLFSLAGGFLLVLVARRFVSRKPKKG